MKSFSDYTLAEFLDQAASDAPVPGGGGVAAMAGALGGAMAAMAANFTVGKAKFAEHAGLMYDTLNRLRPLIDDFRQAVDDDARAFSGISEAYKLPRGDDAEKAARKAAIDAALDASMQVPLRVARHCCEAAELLPPLAGAGNPNLLSDVMVSAVMLEAAARAALVNILVNSRSLDTDAARAAETEGRRIVARLAAVASEVDTIIEGRSQ